VNSALKLIFFSVLVLFMIAAAFSLREFGKPERDGMDNYFLAKGQEETGANNIVAAIVFDYRGLDTLGEATVLFTAVSGIVLLFRGALK